MFSNTFLCWSENSGPVSTRWSPPCRWQRSPPYFQSASRKHLLSLGYKTHLALPHSFIEDIKPSVCCSWLPGTHLTSAVCPHENWAWGRLAFFPQVQFLLRHCWPCCYRKSHFLLDFDWQRSDINQFVGAPKLNSFQLKARWSQQQGKSACWGFLRRGSSPVNTEHVTKEKN